MSVRRPGFWRKLDRTMNTLVVMPKREPAYARAAPHCPAPVSVTSSRTPSRAARKACISAVLLLWLPVGLTPSYL